MKNWHTLDADENRLMNKHYTPGRGGHSVELVVIHHNAGVLSIADIWNVWQDRAASAHYQVESGGRIGQLVWDRDTAWHAANSDINARSIGIEVSNSGGAAQDWPITDTALVEAGKLTAAVCHAHGLGEPAAGRNVRFHREFSSTSCPYHLAPGGQYHGRLMTAARDHYRWLSDPQNEEGLTVSEADRIIEFIADYLGPNNEDTKDNREQLTGGRDMIPGDVAGSYPGWNLGRLVTSAREKGFQGLTLVEMVAVSLAGDDDDRDAARAAAEVDQ